MARHAPAISEAADDSVLKYAVLNDESSRYYTKEERQRAKDILSKRYPLSLTYRTAKVGS